MGLFFNNLNLNYRDSAKLETLRASFQQTVDELKKEKVVIKTKCL